MGVMMSCTFPEVSVMVVSVLGGGFSSCGLSIVVSRGNMMGPGSISVGFAELRVRRVCVVARREVDVVVYVLA